MLYDILSFRIMLEVHFMSHLLNCRSQMFIIDQNFKFSTRLKYFRIPRFSKHLWVFRNDCYSFTIKLCHRCTICENREQVETSESRWTKGAWEWKAVDTRKDTKEDTLTRA